MYMPTVENSDEVPLALEDLQRDSSCDWLDYFDSEAATHVAPCTTSPSVESKSV
jgi:hypothetical protein